MHYASCGWFYTICPKKNQRYHDRNFINDYATSNSVLPMHRWILYSAALIVWCYSYAVDGPNRIAGSSGGTSTDVHIESMQSFLKRAENIKGSDDIAHYRLNGCAGMLKVLRHIFRKGTWDLLREGADLLTNCIKIIDQVE
jgi:hypothetical protein